MKKLFSIFLIAAFFCSTAKPAQRIITCSPNLTEIAYALDLGDKIIGVASESDWPADANKKPKMGSFWQPNTEAIIAARPDLVICETFLQHKEIAETLKRSGVNVLSLRIESIDELYSAIENIGRAADCNDKAKELVSKIKNEISQIKDKVSKAQKVKVLWAVQTEPLRVVGVKTFLNEIIDIAGGQNVIPPTGDQYPSIGTETIMTCDAEIILQSAMGTEDLRKQQESAEKFWSKFVNIPAVKNKKIYVIPADTVLRLGPRLPDGARMVAKCLHPELFTQTQDTKTDR